MAQEPILVIKTLPEIELTLPVIGHVNVKGGQLLFHQTLAWRRRRPLAADYRAFANDAVAASLQPTHPAAAIDTLPPTQRQKLLTAVIRAHGEGSIWRQLYGTSLSLDERFFAVMLWAAAREHVEKRAFRVRVAEMHEEHRRMAERLTSSLPSVTGLSDVLRPRFGLATAMRASLEAAQRYNRIVTSVSPWAFKPSARLAPSLRIAYGLDSVRAGAGVADLIRAGGHSPGLTAALSPYATTSALRAGHTGLAHLSPSWSDTARSAGALSELANVASAGVSAIATKPWAVMDVYGGAGLTGVSDALAGLASAHGLSGLLSDAVRASLDQHTRMLPGASGITALSVTADWSKLTVTAGLQRFMEPLREMQETFAEFDDFFAQWETDSLWFLLSELGIPATRQLAALPRNQVEAALFAAITAVVLEGRFVAALRQALPKASHLSALQLQWLDHALRHAGEGEWVQAIPPLLAGLEGAFQRVAAQDPLVVRTNNNKFISAPKLFKYMGLEPEYTYFLRVRVFGGLGQAFRHGLGHDRERDQVLLGLVALCGWLDYFAERNAMRALVVLMTRELEGAAELVAG